MKNISIVKAYGKMWARNAENIEAIPSEKKCRYGVYILFDGSMPVYVGQGKIQQRIRRHQKGARRQLWDRFSWYVLVQPEMMHDIESLLLKILPRFFRSLNKRGGSFVARGRGRRQINHTAIAISRKRVRSR